MVIFFNKTFHKTTFEGNFQGEEFGNAGEGRARGQEKRFALDFLSHLYIVKTTYVFKKGLNRAGFGIRNELIVFRCPKSVLLNYRAVTLICLFSHFTLICIESFLLTFGTCVTPHEVMCMSERAWVVCGMDCRSGFFSQRGKEREFWVQQSNLTCFWEERECRLTDHSFYKHIFEPLQTQPTRARGNRSSFSPLLLLGLFVEQLGGVVLSDTHILRTHTQTDVHRHVPLNQRGV